MRLSSTSRCLLVADESGPWFQVEYGGSLVSDLDVLLKLTSLPTTALNFVPVRTESIRLVPEFGGTIYGVGYNYGEHARDQGEEAPGNPAVFLKRARAAIGDRAFISLPTDEAHRYEVETELAIVIGRSVREPTADECLNAIAGLMVANDVTDRRLQRSGQVALSKGLDTFCALGPYLRLSSGLESQRERSVQTWVNGQLVQDGSTSKMIHSPSDIIRFLASHLTLEAGDIVLTGTPGMTDLGRTRGGLGIRPGDLVVSQVEGVGTITNHARLAVS